MTPPEGSRIGNCGVLFYAIADSKEVKSEDEGIARINRLITDGWCYRIRQFNPVEQLQILKATASATLIPSIPAERIPPA